MEKIKSPITKSPPGVNLNMKTSITCTNVPESLFEPAATKKHFSKFGRVKRIRLLPKKQTCIVEYEQPSSVEQAVLNAGAYDGFMFDVTRVKPRTRRKSKRDDDPDWVPDSDVEEELSAMGGGPSIVTRQSRMDTSPEKIKSVSRSHVVNQSPLRKKAPVREKPVILQSKISIESPVIVVSQTTLSTSEAASELHQLRYKISQTPDEQWRILDARDRILRAWGGAGARVKIGGATIGTCPDMCPEKERLHRQAEHQVMSLETVPDCDYQLEAWRAVKQYSRSSADQEIPMCYELRPAVVLERTCAYLLCEIADTTRQVTLADWFHFMWDRFRGIRKDITQQALCCAESIRLVEMCARFHAHCAARLADLEHTQFDQKLNTDNLTKCLQTLKHMYSDVAPEHKPREAEFRGYIALLNLGDANFWWEIKHLPQDIQKSEAITFAIKVFNALDNNNYIRFFRLVKEKATYLQACILLRYFNDVRARALARIVKGFAPRGGSRYPAEELMNALAFETVDSMKSFVNHYGLRFAKTDESGLTVILDRNQFIEDSDPYPVARAPDLIESKRQHKVGAVIAGGQVPIVDFGRNLPYSSFNKDGTLKEEALTALDQGYSTSNDSNKDLQSLRDEIRRLAQGSKGYAVMDRLAEKKANVFGQPEAKSLSPGRSNAALRTDDSGGRSKTLFSFKPAIPVAPIEIINNSPEKMDSPGKGFFVFSKPQENKDNLFSMPTNNNGVTNVFGKPVDKSADLFKSQTTFGESKPGERLFKRPETKSSIFSQPINDTKQDLKKLVDSNSGSNIFSKKDEAVFGSKNIFANSNNNIFGKSDADHSQTGNIFGKFSNQTGDIKNPSSVFGAFNKDKPILEKVDTTLQPKSIFASNGEQNAVSPGSLFKSAIRTENPALAQNIFTPVNEPKNGDIYDFNDDAQNELEAQKIHEQKIREEEMRRMEEIRKEEERRHELKLQEEKKRQEELKRKELELKRMEEERKKEEQRKQEELKRLLEEEEERKRVEEARKAELRRKAEIERLFKLRVDKESSEVTEELIDEIKDESVRDLMKEELDKLNKLIDFAGVVTEEIVTQLCAEICYAEMLAEKIYAQKLMRKWFDVWRRHLVRNLKRRNLLEDTPVWITDKTPAQEASYLKRLVEGASLKNMNNIHKGYRFTGELPQLPAPESLNLMEIIKSSLIKRMKHINYSYDKGFFWKITLISPGGQWMYRKIDIDKWLLDSFSDKKDHEVSSSLIYVGKQTWNQLMDFAISVSLKSKCKGDCSEAMEGTNSLLFYTTDNEYDLIKTIEETLQSRYPYQTVPIAIVIPAMRNENLEHFLTNCVNTKKISAFKIFIVDAKNVLDSLTKCTKSALKWLAKNYPGVPPLEIDYLKSICERYLGNEIWLQLRSIKDTRVDTVMKDLNKLVQCYNMGVDKLTQIITDEDQLNYPLFPLELKEYLNDSPVYPKPYEYITSSARNSDNLSEIKNLMKHLKLPNPVADCRPATVDNIKEQIYAYCTQIGWFQYPEKSTLGVTLFELSDILRMPHENFKTYFENFDFGCFLNLIVYEKINSLRDLENRYAVYKKTDLEEYRNAFWLYEVDMIYNLKHKALEYEDTLDEFIHAKRQKIALESLEYLTLDDKDCTLVEESIKDAESKIMKYTDCMEAVYKLESQLEEESKKSMELERRLQAALLDA
ncbi:hypothetical protein MSG28_010340 [Choristoneura fumiferana]|uniref:Uncharacterized protein n=1 Tax=Choristoneura fumiferana TaxID=7141 RepID=A0ACC0KL68_CHOFU|nr:hypothetical protein MSG28_010340 [Choristoneura fumiferana]